MQILRNSLALLVVLLAILSICESRRSAYRLPKLQGRSASGSPSPQDVGSGRDLMKKFMLMRGLFQQPPSDNVIVITQPSSTTTTTTPTGSPTTTTYTTTTTTPTSNSTGRSLLESMHLEDPQDEDEDEDEDEAQDTLVTTMTGRALEDRLDLPDAEEEPQDVVSHKKPQKPLQWSQKFNLKSARLNRKKNLVKKTHRRVHKHPQKKKRQQKRKLNKKQSANHQQRNAEPAVNFIEPYHNDRSQSQAGGQSTSDSRLQRIWRRFQIAN
ncbi:activating signal cointegrator 1 complex subunit 2 homolog [Drosophila santomea]|uniref:activating signal cointegrator 1 complex subunit 2 homolog n=1 Tax=Drosophila santomea TaxID=129105 RepID=UPI0019530ACB|nr:activating signal cointegrator 1 complex subunit 2 homolog [Drosophila santomea]